MPKLDELKSFVANHFHEGTNPESIQKEVQLEELIKGVEAEYNEALEANKRLSQAYRDVVNGTPGKIDPKGRTEDEITNLPDFETALNFVAKGKDIYGQPIQK